MSEKIVESHSYVAIRSVHGDRWWSVPALRGRLSAGAPKDGTAFFIVKVHGSPGPVIRSEDFVKIRGLERDPWLKAIANQDVVDAEQAYEHDIDALFQIVKGTSGSAGSELRQRDPFLIRGVKSDPWLISSATGAVTLTQQKDAATEFLFDLVEVLRDLAQQQEVIETVSVSSNRIELGWTNISPCSRLEWTNSGPLGLPSPTLRFADQRVTAYATVDSELLNQAQSDTLYCAAVSAAAAGVASLASGGAAAAGVFENSFKACLLARNVPDTLSRVVTISTETKCMWP